MAESDNTNTQEFDPDEIEYKLVDISTEEFATKGINTIPLEGHTLDYEGEKIDNVWHIDIRFNHILKEPEHYIVLYPVKTNTVRPIAWPLRRWGLEKLPGMSFFPNTLEEAVPVIARRLLINLLFGRAPGFKKFTPWKVTTWNEPLATALSNHFKHLGLRRTCGLCSIGITEEAIALQCHRLYVNSFQDFAQRYFPGIKRGVVGDHAYVTFDLKAHPMPPIPDDSEERNPVERLANLVKQYCALLEKAEPPQGPEIYIPQEMNAKERKTAVLVYHSIAQRPERVLVMLADHGDPDACLEHAARLLIGLQCVRNRLRAREYLLKAAYSDQASDKVKATAHGLLGEWYVDFAPLDTSARYIFRSCLSL
ncbi:hypothetical protein D9619_012205 [Psilocybe cf. subviscida]|uniref:Uncharacterized protein n=1 Tax=Psilocybe cf. subviscida TaxID=2480587 RepID=A0A8H5B7C6_9AGAR|nr:hypothetical protein D9619_012205 [Psilocybe cf. subviscida]